MLNLLRRRATPLIFLICFAFIAMRMGGVHAHRHLELAQGIQALHLSHGLIHETHADHHSTPAPAAAGNEMGTSVGSVQHEDIDVELISSAGKLFKLDGSSLLLFAVAAICLLAPRRGTPVPDYSPPRRRTLRAYLRPPLRGPPLISVA